MSTVNLSWHIREEWKLCLETIGRMRSAYRPILRGFAEWLRFDRGLQPSTIYESLLFARRFIEQTAGEQDPVAALRRLTPDRIESFFLDLAQRSGYGAQRTFRVVVRRLLRYTRYCKWTDRTLECSIPRWHSYKLAHIPRGIDDAQIRHLLASVPDETPVGIRDRVILMMLAVYGTRSGQLRALRLEDLRWKDRQILFPPHKGGKPVLHTLVPQVAKALARYLQDARPDVPHAEVFLRCRRPFNPLGASAITRVVYTRLARASIKTTSKGAHIFRHAFATRLLRQRHSLKTIADLLGHHDLGSVAIYTKVDEPALREVAAHWPESLQ